MTLSSPFQNSTVKTEPKSPPNGHIASDSVGAPEKKPAKKVTGEPASPSKQSNQPRNVKKAKNKKTTEKNEVELDDKESGEWVELISKKERKNRKQKEEQLLSNESITNKEDKALVKSNKAKKAKTSKNAERTVEPNAIIDDDIGDKQVNTSQVIETIDSNKDQSQDQNGIANSQESAADMPDIYELAKEKRVPKKSQKQRNSKRNSESEHNLKSEALNESEPKPNLNLSDKLTASIVANYEGTDKADNSTNKKKEKNKKKQKESDTSIGNGVKQVSNGETIEEKTFNEEVTENSNESDAALAIGSKSPSVTNSTDDLLTDQLLPTVRPSEDEFKVVNKKRRARRE